VPAPVEADFEDVLEDALCKYGGERDFAQAAVMGW